MELIASCAFGLEKLVQDEVKRLGLWVIKTEDGRVTFNGDQSALIRANLWMRCADRIQIKIGEFSAVTFDQLFDRINALEWEKYIGAADAFPVNAVSVKSALHSEPAIQSIVKKAVVKRLQAKNNTEILPENSGAVYCIIVKSNKDQFVVSIDSSGESLHKRGYRTAATLAPIKETLAAAMVKLSDWTPERTLIDPFCGSGTIAIEAAQVAQNVAPGLKREFAFKNWKWINQKNIAEAYEEAKKAAKPAQKLNIYCFDIDAEALKIAEENAKNANLADIHFKRADFNDLDFAKFENCTFIANPPYGERIGASSGRVNCLGHPCLGMALALKLGRMCFMRHPPELASPRLGLLEERADVQKMYREFGKKFAQTKNCSLFIITSHEDFPKAFGRKADRNRKLFNGKIRCYLFSYLAK